MMMSAHLSPMHNAAGIRDSDFEEPVANNSTIYAINAVALASAAGIAALNPPLVRALHLGLWLLISH